MKKNIETKEKLITELITELIKDLPDLDVKLPKDKIMLYYIIERLNNDLTYFANKIIKRNL